MANTGGGGGWYKRRTEARELVEKLHPIDTYQLVLVDGSGESAWGAQMPEGGAVLDRLKPFLRAGYLRIHTRSTPASSSPSTPAPPGPTAAVSTRAYPARVTTAFTAIAATLLVGGCGGGGGGGKGVLEALGAGLARWYGG